MENISEAERKKAFTALMNARGIFKGQGKAKTDDKFRKLRENAGEDYIIQLEKEFGLYK